MRSEIKVKGKLATRFLNKRDRKTMIMEIKNKGRVVKGTTLVKNKMTKRIDFRVTDTEYEYIQSLEESFGMRRSDIIRSRVIRESDPLLIDSMAVLKELNSLGAELGRSGNNINQLAKHANILEKSNALHESVISRFNILIDIHNGIIEKLNRTLRKITREGAKNYKK